jgi:hypothetical protein
MNKEMKIVIEEVARIALESKEISSYIGHELDLSQEYLDEVYAVLERLLSSEADRNTEYALLMNELEHNK